MIKYNLFVGSNNETKELEKDLILETVSLWFGGFTASEVIGYWKGQKENTLKIEIVINGSVLNEDKINKLVLNLKEVCKQDSIMVEKVNSVITFN